MLPQQRVSADSLNHESGLLIWPLVLPLLITIVIHVHRMPFEDWKARHQTETTEAKLAEFKQAHAANVEGSQAEGAPCCGAAAAAPKP